MVLRLRDQPVEKLGCGDAGVRLEPGALAKVHQTIGFFGTRGHYTTGAMIFERAPDKHLVIGQQGRGERIAFKPAQMLAVEREGNGLAPVDKATVVCQTGAHAKSLQDQPGRLSEMRSLISCGGSSVWAG